MKRATYSLPVAMLRGIISIHTLCEEGDMYKAVKIAALMDFNPHPLWRGRRCKSYSDCLTVNISIHTLCEEGDGKTYSVIERYLENFNPHPLWRGRRRWGPMFSDFFWYFNPHPLWRGRLVTFRTKPVTVTISIHTLCEEGDGVKSAVVLSMQGFQSTPSVKRATN